MDHEIIIAGFGGQGIMAMGSLLAYASMLEKKKVSWLPSYGPEMRGGTANCTVVISEEEIGSPVVSEPTAVIAMNRPSLDKFEPLLKPEGLLFINTSLIDRKPERRDVQVMEIPATTIAGELGNLRVANMVMLGAFVRATEVVGFDTLLVALQKVLPERYLHLIPLNEEALRRGASYRYF